MRAKRTFLVALAMAAAFASIFGFKNAAAQSVNNFRIDAFDADYYLARQSDLSSSLKVVEIIKATFPSYDQNHGIERAIPEAYQGHTLSLKIQSVEDQNKQPVNYTTRDSGDNKVLRIGDAGKYVHGSQTYVISYTMRNVIAYFNDHDEFYWDINGDGWAQNFDSVTARIHLPSDIALNLQSDRRCYSGNPGSNNTCGIVLGKQKDETVLTAKASNLLPYQTMTIVLGFGKGTFAQGPEVRQEQIKNLIKLIATLIIAVGTPLLTLALMIRSWIKHGRDPRGRGVIIAEYEPPKGLNSLFSDYVMQEGLRSQAVTALLIELAIRKYLVIYEQKKKGLLSKSTSYELELISFPGQLSEIDQQVVKMIFGDSPSIGGRVKLDALKNKLASKINDLDKKLAANLTEDGYFSLNPNKVRNKYYSWGGGILGVGFLLTFAGPLAVIGAGLIPSGLIMLLFARAMPARSQKGVEIHDQLLGLKEYIKMAEADRLKFLQSPEGAEKIQAAGYDPSDPEMQVKLFEELLPYAMLFGLEKDWAKQFADLYKQPPEWYNGNMATFNTIYLASALGSFQTANATAFSPPSSSSSSGLGGGGFSGGGGGGGGGGGW